MKKLLVLLLTLVLILTLLTGCGGGNNVSSSDKNTVLKWALDSDIISLDPIYAYDTTTNQVVNQIVDTLLYIETNGSVSPSLASSWQIVDDVTYVYQIRSDVKFSDGSPMTMEDVLFSLNRHTAKGSDSFVAWMFDSVESIEQTGDWEITVRLSSPDAFWQYVPATSGGAVISKTYYEQHADDFGTATGGILATGAYRFDRWINGSEIRLVRNENYWDKSAPCDFTEIDYTIITEDTTRIAALKTGQTDISVNVSIDMLDQVKEMDNVSLNSVHAYRIDYLAFNTARKPFDDVNVRRAICYAIDTETLVSGIYGEYGEPGSGLLFGDALYTLGDAADWEAFAETLDNYSVNLDKAKEYLAASAYPDGFSCRLAVSNISYYQSMAVYVQSALSQIGIDVQIEQHTYDEMVTLQFGGMYDADGLKSFDMALFDWQADFPDPAGNPRPILLSANAGEGGSNASCYNNAEVDALFYAENASVAPDERIALIKEYSKILLDEVPVYVICFSNQTFAVNNRMNASVGPLYYWDLTAKNFTLK